MEEGDDQPAAEVSKDKGFRIPHFSPGAPRADPRVAMRPSQAPRTPPKSYKDGGNRKRKREPSLTPGGSKQPEARAKTSKQMGRFWRSQKGEELEFFTNSYGRRVALLRDCA